MDFIDYLKEFADRTDTHEVCVTCGRICKMSYSMWTGMMPPEEYCPNYIEHPLWYFTRFFMNSELVTALGDEV